MPDEINVWYVGVHGPPFQGGAGGAGPLGKVADTTYRGRQTDQGMFFLFNSY